MKSRFLSILLCIVLIAFSFVFGAAKGWKNERALVDAQLSSLQTHLDTRVETASNILTVARRHMDADSPALQSLQHARDVLSGNAALAVKADANQTLAQDARALLDALAELSTVQQDDRDSMYVNILLPQMLQESESYTSASAYNTAAQDFNTRFDKNVVSSFIARIFGVERCEVFSSTLEEGETNI